MPADFTNRQDRVKGHGAWYKHASDKQDRTSCLLFCPLFMPFKSDHFVWSSPVVKKNNGNPMIRRLLQVVEVISKAQSQKLPQASEAQNKFSFASQIFSHRSSLEENLVDKILPSLR